jgi:hypothetical protein
MIFSHTYSSAESGLLNAYVSLILMNLGVSTLGSRLDLVP